MKKTIKGLGLSLCAVLLLAGCSCKKDEDNSVKANINNGESALLSNLGEGTKNYTLQEIYDELKSSYANETVANKLIEILGDKLLLSDPDWKDRYDTKVLERLKALTEDSSYFKNGEFDEELLVASLNSKLYSVTCGASDGVEKLEELKCNYDNYVNKALKVEVINELLKEKYVYDSVFKEKANILTSKKTRLVEYLAISTSEEEASEFINDAVKSLKEDANVTLDSLATNWKNKMLANLQKEYDKIGTKEDANGSIMQSFTGDYTYDRGVGLKLKQKEIENKNYYSRVIVNSDNKDILNSTLIERILSENIVDAAAEKTYEMNGNRYVVNPLADSNIDERDIVIKDTSNGLYYLVKVEVVDSESKDDLVYDAVKVLATNTTLVGDYLNYFVEQNKASISVHDEEVYEYLKTLYPTIFVD